MAAITSAKAKALTERGMYWAGDTLYLRIGPTGAKSWIQRLTINGKRCDLGLGSLHLVTLREARMKAWDNRRAVYDGRDPLAERRKAEAPTFREAAAQTMAGLRAGWTSQVHASQWVSSLEAYAFPILGARRVDSIRGGDVLRVLTPIWTAKPETARRVRQRIRTVLGWAQAHGFTASNVAGDTIDGALPKNGHKRQHYAALPYGEVGTALRAIDRSRATAAAKLCLRFLVLTASRSGEARGARWSEIDTEAQEWRIPPERMKSGREHRVPLSPGALAVLERAKGLSDGKGLVFPNQRGRVMDGAGFSQILRASGVAGTVHGMRSAFRDWCAETGQDREVAEAALAHVVGGTEGAYFRSDLFARRRKLMEGWGTFLTDYEPPYPKAILRQPLRRLASIA